MWLSTPSPPVHLQKSLSTQVLHVHTLCQPAAPGLLTHSHGLPRLCRLQRQACPSANAPQPTRIPPSSGRSGSRPGSPVQENLLQSTAGHQFKHYKTQGVNKEILSRLPHREWAPGQTTRWDNPSDIFFSPSKKNPVPGHSGTHQVPTLPHNLLGFPVLKRNPHYIYPSVCMGIREQPRELSLSFYHTDLRDGSGHQAW